MQFLLNLAVELALDEDASPCDLVSVHINSIAVHEVVLPGAFVAAAVLVDHLAEAVHAAVGPLSSVHVPARVLVSTMAEHLVVDPLALVLFTADLVAQGVGGAGKHDLAMAVFHLFVIVGEDPVPDVESLVDILKLSGALSRNFGLLLQKVEMRLM